MSCRREVCAESFRSATARFRDTIGSMKRLFRSFSHAIRGIRATILSETNAKIHLVVTAVTVVLGLWLGLSSLEWCVIVGCIGAVIATECMNTGLESLADALHPTHHPLVGKAKDAAAGAVLLMAIASVVIGLLIFCPKLWETFLR